ncbi:MAG: hypothetical protein RIR83_1770 [Pseudomonadota bacterium]
MKQFIRGIVALLGIISLGVSPIGLAQASYPQKPIRLIVPFPPGGSTDIFSRMLGEKLTQIWKQPVIIENKAGARGILER